MGGAGGGWRDGVVEVVGGVGGDVAADVWFGGVGVGGGSSDETGSRRVPLSRPAGDCYELVGFGIPTDKKRSCRPLAPSCQVKIPCRKKARIILTNKGKKDNS